MILDIKTEIDFDFESEEYRNLFARSNATGFQAPTWLSRFYATMVPAHSAKPCIITFRDKGRLEGLVALIKRRKSGLDLLEATDLGVSDYAAPVLSPELDRQLRDDRDLQTAYRETLRPHDILRIRPVRGEHCHAWQALTGIRPHVLGFSAHSVDLQPPYEDWRRQKLDPKMASMAARKARRWRKQHQVSLERLEDSASISRAITTLAHLRKGRFEGDPVPLPHVTEFFAQAAIACANSGEAETWMLSSDGDVASVLFGLTHNGRFLYLLLGADYDAHGRHSPGLQLFEGVIEDWMRRGGTNFDFTIGDEPFKKQFGTQAERMSLFLNARSIKGKLALKLMRNRLVR